MIAHNNFKALTTPQFNDINISMYISFLPIIIWNSNLFYLEEDVELEEAIKRSLEEM